MNKLKSVWQETVKTIKQFPVEFAFGATMFVLMFVAVILGGPHDNNISAAGKAYCSHVYNVAAFAFQLFVIIYTLHKILISRQQTGVQTGRQTGTQNVAQTGAQVRVQTGTQNVAQTGAQVRVQTGAQTPVWKYLYIASYFFFIPLLFINLDNFINSDSKYFAVTIILSFMLLYLDFGGHVRTNEQFAHRAVNLTIHGLFTILICAISILAVVLIVLSVNYIFEISNSISEHISYACGYFICFIVAPLLFCNFMSKEEESGTKNHQISHIIVDFVMSPTILIYTLILFIYFITIVCKWSLPKGDIAYMVSAFVAVTLIGFVLQYVLPKRYYDWFYKNFTWIAIPPLVLYWIGACHRIAQYGLTQERVYLIIVGVLMTLFVLMLATEKTKKFRAMLLIAFCAVAVFTYIPGVSANSIGICSQTKRFEQKLSQLHLLDPVTHKITANIDVAKISTNQKLIKEYAEAKDIYDYLSGAMGHEIVESKYGKFNFDYDYDSDSDYTQKNAELYFSSDGANVDLGDYNVMVQQDIRVSCDKDSIKVSPATGDKILFSFPIGKYIKDNPGILKEAHTHPEKLLVFRGDSSMLVIGSLTVSYKEGKISDISCYDASLFLKK
ncbi:MAG: DUF4153 domain-containing protein [Bacteroidales bacterium]|jgi:hypothetical protein|nr:DUF4153 domain-containing protein [Bacteroidales bacterium]